MLVARIAPALLLLAAVPPPEVGGWGGAARPDEAAFRPHARELLAKRYTERTRLEVDSFEARVNGQPVEREMPEATVVSTRTIAFTDDYQQVEDGRILALERAFDELAASTRVELANGGGEEHEVAASSDLDGAVVRFEWDAEHEEYRRSFEEGGTGDDDDLAALELDADLVGFLPAKPVSEGDTWDVDAAHLGRVLAPSGDVRLIADDLGEDPYRILDREAMLGAMQSSLGEVDAPWEGAIEARYLGRKEVDGQEVGRIELTIDASADADLLPRLLRTIERVGLRTGDEFTDLSLRWTLNGKAELDWDLDEGHARSFRLEGEVEAEAHLAYTQEVYDQKLELEGDYTVSGDTVVELAVD